MKELVSSLQRLADTFNKMQVASDLSHEWSHDLKPVIINISANSKNNHLTWNVLGWVQQGMEKSVFLRADSFLRRFSYEEFEQSVKYVKENIGLLTNSALQVEVVNYYLDALLEKKYTKTNGKLGRVAKRTAKRCIAKSPNRPVGRNR
jgi:hypothetical protein